MTFDEYQRLAARTINKDLYEKEQTQHAIYGMCSEIGELQGIYQKGFQGHEIDEAHLKKEAGDLLWFLAEYCTSQGWIMDEIAEMNIEKLRKRYPEGFREEGSLNRVEGDI